MGGYVTDGTTFEEEITICMYVHVICIILK